MHALPGVGQIQSVSVLQSGEHPSPPVRFPSSHVSAGGVGMLFPHGLHDPGGPSQGTSRGLLMSSAALSWGMSIAASIPDGGPPPAPAPPWPVPLLLEIPAQPPAASASRAADQQAAGNPGQDFTSLLDGGRGGFGSTPRSD